MPHAPLLAAGHLRHRVTIQRATESRDDIGGVIQSWATLESRWAKIEPLQGRELEAAKQIEARVTHRVTIRPVSGLTASDRLLYGSRIFHIFSMIDIEEFGVKQQCLCMEITT